MLPTDPLAWAITQYREDRRNTTYKRYHDYADGAQGLTFATPKFQQTFGPLYDALTYNRSASVIDAIADRLMVESFNLRGGGSADPAIALWHDNRMDKREGEVNQEALTAGDGYVIVWPHPQSGQPVIWPQDAACVRVLYDDEQPGLIILATKLWRTTDNFLRLNVYLPDRLEKYISGNTYRTGTLPPSATVFEQHKPEGDLQWPLRYDWFREQAVNIPVFHFANNARTGHYGRSELKDVIPLQDGLNKALADLMIVAETAGFPQRWVTGHTPTNDPATGLPQKVDMGADKILGFGDADVRVGQFDVAPLPQLIAVGEAFDLMIARVSRVPVHYLGLTSNFPSGESLKTAEAPFVKKLQDRIRAYGNVWEDVMTLAMRMDGIDIAPEIEAVYESPEPRSEMEELQAATLKKQIGYSLEQILRDMGKNESEIAVIMKDKAAALERQQALFDGGNLGNPDTGQAAA
jgi:hypothetical protein